MCQKYDIPYKPIGTCKPFTIKNPYRFENTQLLLKSIDNTVELLNIEPTKHRKDLLTLKCGCGNIFKRERQSLQRNKERIICPQCYNKIRGREKSLKLLQNKIEVFEKAGYEILSDKNYIREHDKLLIKTKDGYLSYVTYNEVSKGFNPTIFSILTNKNNILYNARVLCKNNGLDIEILDYIDDGRKIPYVKCRCKCGEIFETSINNFKRKDKKKSTCNKCSIKTSQWCKAVEDYLDENKIIYKKEVRFNDCKDIFSLPFDYQIDINNGLIEVDGEQHFSEHGFGRTKEEKIYLYKRIVYHDKIKTEYCKRKNIPFLRISFKDVINGSYKEKIENFIHIKNE